MMAATAVLAEYDEEVICRVTDPREGLPRKQKFLPCIAEISEACDEAAAYLVAEQVAKAKGYEWNGRFWEKVNGKNPASD